MIRAEYLYTDLACAWNVIASGRARSGDVPGANDVVAQLGFAQVIMEVRSGDPPQVVIRKNPYGEEPGPEVRGALALLAYMATRKRWRTNPGTVWRVGGEVVEIGLSTLLDIAPLPRHVRGGKGPGCTLKSCIFRRACRGRMARFADVEPLHLDREIANIYHQLVLMGADPLYEIGNVILCRWQTFSHRMLVGDSDERRARLWLKRLYSYPGRHTSSPRLRNETVAPGTAMSPPYREERNIGLYLLEAALGDVPPHLLEALLASTADLLSMRRPELTAECVGGDVDVAFKGYAREYRGYIVPTERTLTALFGEEEGRRLHSALEEALDDIIEGVWRW